MTCPLWPVRLVEFKYLLLHLFVLIGRKGELANVVQRARLLRFIVTKFCLKNRLKRTCHFNNSETNKLRESHPETPTCTDKYFTCNVYDPSRAWVTNEQGSRPEATSSRSCRHNRYLSERELEKKNWILVQSEFSHGSCCWICCTLCSVSSHTGMLE